MDKKIEFETFRDFGNYDQTNFTQKEPSCWNGVVKYKKYKITVEEVTESDDIIKTRLQKLWDECDNFHHRRPLINEARKYGLELKFLK